MNTISFGVSFGSVGFAVLAVVNDVVPVVRSGQSVGRQLLAAQLHGSTGNVRLNHPIVGTTGT